MGARTYRPDKKKIIRDILIVAVIIYAVTLFGTDFTMAKLLGVTLFVLITGLIYMCVVGVLPSISITNNDEIEHKSEYARTHRVKISDVSKVTLGAGKGGRYALFIYQDSNENASRRLKIKTNYFDRKDIADFVKNIRNKKNIQTNPELEAFIANA